MALTQRHRWIPALQLRAICLIGYAALVLGSNYYDVLELSKDASTADVKKAYRRLALNWHPDKSKHPEAPKKFREVAEAYEVLSDAERRKQYDLGGDAGFDFGSFEFPSADDIFKEFFGDEDPFAEFARMGEQIEKEMQKTFSEIDKMTSDASKAEAGLLGSVGSFFSSFFSSSSSNGGPAKVVSETVEVKSTPEGTVKRTVKSDGNTRTEQVETVKPSLSGASSSDVAAAAPEVIASPPTTSSTTAAPVTSAKPEPPSTTKAPEQATTTEAPAASADAVCSADGSCKNPAVPEADICGMVEMQSGAEPADGLVKHVDGSACCNPAPLAAPTDPRGCCERCLGSAACDVFVLQPSSGSCWLLRWVGAERGVNPSNDRLLGERPQKPGS